MTDIEKMAQMESQELYGDERYNVSRMVERMDRNVRLDEAFRKPLETKDKEVCKKNKEL